MKLVWLSGLLALAQAARNGSMAFVVGCAELVSDRIDPIVSPGQEGSHHAHQIFGGNSFAPSMAPGEYDPAQESSCTSCTFAEDKSNYWTPILYFRARNGTFKRVPQHPPLFHEYLGPGGAMRVYYFNRHGGAKVTAFPKGFRMRYGHPEALGDERIVEDQGMGYQCLYDGGTRYYNVTTYLPRQPCVWGIVTHIWFPTCWDGVNIDSDDHRSHVAFQTEDVEEGAPCPDTHPVRIPQLFLETSWDTSGFNDPELWPEDPEEQPFVWSTGDRTGYDFHADFLFGWDEGKLEGAMETYYSDCPSCLGLTEQANGEPRACTVEQVVREDVEGWLDELPGGVRVFG